MPKKQCMIVVEPCRTIAYFHRKMTGSGAQDGSIFAPNKGDYRCLLPNRTLVFWCIGKADGTEDSWIDERSITRLQSNLSFSALFAVRRLISHSPSCRLLSPLVAASFPPYQTLPELRSDGMKKLLLSKCKLMDNVSEVQTAWLSTYFEWARFYHSGSALLG